MIKRGSLNEYTGVSINNKSLKKSLCKVNQKYKKVQNNEKKCLEN